MRKSVRSERHAGVYRRDVAELWSAAARGTDDSEAAARWRRKARTVSGRDGWRPERSLMADKPAPKIDLSVGRLW